MQTTSRSNLFVTIFAITICFQAGKNIASPSPELQKAVPKSIVAKKQRDLSSTDKVESVFVATVVGLNRGTKPNDGPEKEVSVRPRHLVAYGRLWAMERRSIPWLTRSISPSNVAGLNFSKPGNAPDSRFANSALADGFRSAAFTFGDARFTSVGF